MSTITDAKCKCNASGNASAGSSNATLQCCVKQRSRRMRAMKSLYDVSFAVGDVDEQKEFEAHKVVLAAASDVFATMFNGTWETGAPIKVPDIDPPIFDALLRFFYTDDVSLSEDSAFKILYAAKKYAVFALEDRCLTFLNESLCAKNALNYLSKAQFLGQDDLAASCAEYIDRNAETVLKSQIFTEIDLALLRFVLARDSLETPEINIFRAVLRWVSAECKRKGLKINAANQRLVLDDAGSLIRLPLLTYPQFLTKVVPSGLLSDKELLDLSLYFAGHPRAPFNYSITCRQIKNNPPFPPMCCLALRFLTVATLVPRTSGPTNYFDELRFSFDSDVKLVGFSWQSYAIPFGWTDWTQVLINDENSNKLIYSETVTISSHPYGCNIGESLGAYAYLPAKINLHKNVIYSANLSFTSNVTNGDLAGERVLNTSRFQKYSEVLTVKFYEVNPSASKVVVGIMFDW